MMVCVPYSFLEISSSILVTPVPCSVIPGPDFGFTVLKLDVFLQQVWLLLEFLTLYLPGLRLIYVMIPPDSLFIEVLDLHL